MNPQPKPTKEQRPARRRSARIPRKAKPRQQSKSPRAKARDKADREWQADVKSAEACQRCLVHWSRDAHHIFGKKAHPALRLRRENGIALCRPCHGWAHRHPVEFRGWLAKIAPINWAALLALKAKEAK